MMTELEFDYTNLMTIRQVLDVGVAFTEGTLRRWLFNRQANGLSQATVSLRESLLLDIPRFNDWLAGDQGGKFDFRNLRTKEQIVASSWLSKGTVEYWLRERHSNGLEDAVLTKSSRRLYIDLFKFNLWLKQHCESS